MFSIALRFGLYVRFWIEGSLVGIVWLARWMGGSVGEDGTAVGRRLAGDHLGQLEMWIAVPFRRV